MGEERPRECWRARGDADVERALSMGRDHARVSKAWRRRDVEPDPVFQGFLSDALVEVGVRSRSDREPRSLKVSWLVVARSPCEGTLRDEFAKIGGDVRADDVKARAVRAQFVDLARGDSTSADHDDRLVGQVERQHQRVVVMSRRCVHG